MASGMLLSSSSTTLRRSISKQRYALVSRCCFSSEETKPYYVPTLTERRDTEKGTGGRSSISGLKVALFGASGFLGNYVCGELGTNGFMAYFGNRGDELEMRHCKLSFDLGRSRFVFYNPRDRDSIREVIADADVVVNMIGKYYETGQPVTTNTFPFVTYRQNYSFEETNVDIPRTLAEICLEMQVDNFIHVSSASASPNAISEWSRTKYAGEQAIKEVYPWATIVRPTQIFGKDDRLLHWFARMAQWHRAVPLLDGGHSLTQPVHVSDVARTIQKICDDPGKFVGRQVDCFGPTDYTYLELANFVNDITERDRPIFNMPRWYYRKMAQVLQWTRNPLMTPDLVDIWSEDFLPTFSSQSQYAEQQKAAVENGDASSGILTMRDLGIVDPVPIERESFNHLQAYRLGGRFYRVKGYH